jgi:hypothetical protein
VEYLSKSRMKAVKVFKLRLNNVTCDHLGFDDFFIRNLFAFFIDNVFKAKAIELFMIQM